MVCELGLDALGRGFRARAAAVVIALMASSAAHAQVMEIGTDGSVTDYAGPTQFLPDGATPIHRMRAPPRVIAPSATPSTDVSQVIREASARYSLSAQLLEAVAWRESGFNPSAVSAKGARGLMQLTPGTARALGVDPGDLKANTEGGAAYLALMMRRFDGDLIKALAAYNAGPDAVERFGGPPPYAETTAYVDAILDRLSRSSDPAGKPGVRP